MRAVLIDQIASLTYGLKMATDELQDQYSEFRRRQISYREMQTYGLEIQNYQNNMANLRGAKDDFWENRRSYFEKLHDPSKYTLEELDGLVQKLLVTLQEMDQPLSVNYLEQLPAREALPDAFQGRDYELHFRTALKNEAISTLNHNRRELWNKETEYKRDHYYRTNSPLLSELGRSLREYRRLENQIRSKEREYQGILSNLSTEARSISLSDAEAYGESLRNQLNTLSMDQRLLEESRDEILREKPELGAVNLRFEDFDDNQALLNALTEGFDLARQAMDEVYKKVVNDDMPLEALAPVVERVRRQMGILPAGEEGEDEYRLAVNQWLRRQRNRDLTIKILGTVIPLGIAAALFITGVGAGAAISIGFTKAAAAAGAVGGAISLATSVYNFDRADDQNDARLSQAGASGSLVDDPEAIRREYTLAIVDLILAGVDLGVSAYEIGKVMKLVGQFSDARIGSRVVLQLDDLSQESVGKASRIFNNWDQNQSKELLDYVGRHENVGSRLDVIEEIGIDEICDPVNGLTIEDRIMNITIRDLGDARMRNADIIQRFESSQPSSTRGVYSQENLGELTSFQDEVDMVLRREGMSLKEFERMRQLPVSELSETDALLMQRVRNMIPAPTNNSLMQKVIPVGDIDQYLNGNFTQVSGFVTEAADTRGIAGSADVFESLRLDYKNTKFSSDMDSYGVIRFKTDDVGQLGSENIFDPSLGGMNEIASPGTGHGFTSSRNGNIIPEYAFTDGSRYNVLEGAELYRLIMMVLRH